MLGAYLGYSSANVATPVRCTLEYGVINDRNHYFGLGPKLITDLKIAITYEQIPIIELLYYIVNKI